MMDASGIVNEFYICLALNMMKDDLESSYFPLMRCSNSYYRSLFLFI